MKKTPLNNQRGAAIVEFAILVSLLLVFVFGIIEFGFLWLQSNYIGNAAREGARIAAKESDPDLREQAAQDAVKGVLGGLYSTSEISNCCGSGNFIQVAFDDDPGTASIDLGGGESVSGVRVTVTVQTAQYWDPILWDLLSLLQGPDRGEIDSVTQSSIFVLEE